MSEGRGARSEERTTVGSALLAPRSSLAFWVAAACAGALFFASLGRLWPLAAADLTLPRDALVRRAAAVLRAHGMAAPEHAVATQVTVDGAVLDYVEREFGRDVAQRLVREGAPLVAYDVLFKRERDPDGRVVTLHPGGGVLAFSRGVQDDEPGARLGVDSARALARDALARGLALDLAGVGAAAWRETGASSRERPRRVDHTFTYERVLSAEPELRERAVVVVSGAGVTAARRALVVPAAGERAARAREAPERALQTAGFILLAAGAIGALAVFLLRLRDGSARLGRAAVWSGVVFTCAFLTNALADFDLMAAWDPLWPRWIASFSRLARLSEGTAWTFVVLFAFIAAGDALDREARAGRGESLWLLGRGRVTDPRVGLASLRGFAVGLVCGAVMTLAVLALERVAGARAQLQPRGFFFYALNSAAPSLSTLFFFTNIALLEELGYRFFAGAWLLRVTRRRWLAILLPATVYGLTHTGLSFLPPEEPFWGRAVVMTLVGCVWGWAFLRWDALTVVVSHLTSDLFIFNWPRLASAHPDVRAAALATVAVPLLPAVAAAVAALAGRARRRHHGAELHPPAGEAGPERSERERTA